MAKCTPYGVPYTGKIGPNTLMVREREVLARICQNLISNGAKPTEAQRLSQMAMANNMLIWRCFSHMLTPTFPDRKLGRTEYNAFMSTNMKQFAIFLPKEMVEHSATVLAPVQINTGSLAPSIDYWKDADADWMVTSLLLGDLQIDENTTVGELSSALAQCNKEMFAGGKAHYIDFFLGHQSIDINTHYPTATMKGKRLILDPESDQNLWEATDGSLGFQSYKGHLATPFAVRNLYAWIHLKKTSNFGVLSTTQSMMGDNNDIVNRFSTEEAFLAACESYGGFKSKFLTPYIAKINAYNYELPTFATVAGTNPDPLDNGQGGSGTQPGGGSGTGTGSDPTNPGGGSNPGSGGGSIDMLNNGEPADQQDK